MRRRGTGALAVVAVSIGLAATVLASRGGPGDRTAAAFEAAAVGRTLFLSILGLAFAVAVGLAVWALWPDGSGAATAPPPLRWLPYLVVAGLIVVLALIAPERPPRPEADAPPASAAGRDAPDAEAGPGLLERASPTASLTIAALAVAALVAWTVVHRHRADGEGVGGDVGAPAAGGAEGADAELPPDLVADLGSGDLASAIAAVEAEPDPRRAVLLAYAVLDARLRGSAAARPRAATPHEWLAHIRRVHSSDAPAAAQGAARLTALYERARFAASPMSLDDRSSAVRALHALRTLPAPEGAS